MIKKSFTPHSRRTILFLSLIIILSLSVSASFFEPTNKIIWVSSPTNLSSIGNVSGSGTTNYIPMWNGTQSINNSIISQSSQEIMINGSFKTTNSSGTTKLYMNSTNGRLTIGVPTGYASNLHFHREISSGDAFFTVTNDAVRVPFNSEPNTMVKLDQAWNAEGGAYLAGYSVGAAKTAFYFDAYIGSTAPSAAAMIFSAGKASAANATTALGNNEQVFGFENNYARKITMTGNGYLGFGTTRPDNVIDVNVSGVATIRARTTDKTTSSYGGVRFEADIAQAGLYSHGSARTITRYGVNLGNWTEIAQSAGSGLVISTYTLNNPLILATYNKTRIMIEGDGDVGIGTTTPTQKLDVNGSVNITGNLYVSGNMSIKRPYGMFSDNATQGIAVADTAQAVNFTITEDSWEITKSTNNQNFTFLASGDYLIELSAIVMAGAPNKHVEIWVQRNGINVPRSNTKLEIPFASIETVISVPFILDMNSGDSMRIMWASDDTGSQMLYTTNTSYSPETPSIIMTVSKISEITP